MYNFIILLFGFTWLQVNAYVLLQIEKNENNATVDALIHKIIPNKDLQLNRKSGFSTEKELDSILFAIDDGEQNYNLKSDTDGIPRMSIAKTMKNMDKLGRQKRLKPQRSDKGSMKIQLTAQSVMNALTKLIENKQVRRYMKNLADKAADAFKTIRNELNTQVE